MVLSIVVDHLERLGDGAPDEHWTSRLRTLIFGLLLVR
jgi:hypothetical protein